MFSLIDIFMGVNKAMFVSERGQRCIREKIELARILPPCLWLDPPPFIALTTFTNVDVIKRFHDLCAQFYQLLSQRLAPMNIQLHLYYSGLCN